MAVGDKWQVSFAAPIPNPRFTAWPPTAFPEATDGTEGPIGWVKPFTSGSTITMRPWGYTSTPGPACAALFTASISLRSFQTRLPKRSLPPYGIEMAFTCVYKSDKACNVDLFWYDFFDSNTGNNQYALTSGDWKFYHSSTISQVGISGVEIQFYASSVPLVLWLGGVWLRWEPTEWGSAPYSTLQSFPLVNGLVYAPLVGSGEIETQADSTRLVMGLGTRPEKWVLRAEYDDLEEADYLTLQRHWMGSRGMLDGFPRPVAIRPYLADIAVRWAPEIIVGYFTEFSFSPKSIGGSYRGSFTLEEA